MLCVFCAGGGMIVLTLKKVKNQELNGDEGSSPSDGTKISHQGDEEGAQSTIDILNFKEIKNGVIDMGDYKYRAVLECSSLNYHLKTPAEQQRVHMSFKKFLDSLTFPISINIQTRTMDLTRRLEQTKREIEASKAQFPQLKEYADAYYEEMADLPNTIGNNKEKRKYIVIPYNESGTLKGLTESEKLEDAQRNLDIRVSAVRDGLNAIGIKAKRLDTKGLVELIYNSFNKNGNVDIAEALCNGEYTDTVVYGNPADNDITYDAYIDWVLYDAQTRITTEVMTGHTPDYLKEQYQEILERLGEIRDELGAQEKNN